MYSPRPLRPGELPHAQMRHREPPDSLANASKRLVGRNLYYGWVYHLERMGPRLHRNKLSHFADRKFLTLLRVRQDTGFQEGTHQQGDAAREPHRTK